MIKLECDVPLFKIPVTLSVQFYKEFYLSKSHYTTYVLYIVPVDNSACKLG